MPLEGGLRDRMLFESFLNAVVDDLTARGWFDAGRRHTDISVVDEFPDPDGTTEVPINTLAFSWLNGSGTDMEMGSNAEEHLTSLFVDFFAETDALGRHLTGDIYAFLKKNRALPVYDYQQATPPIEFYIEVHEDVDKRKPRRATNPWQKHWYVVSAVVTDERSNA